MATKGEPTSEREITRVINASWGPMRSWLKTFEAQSYVRSGASGSVIAGLPWDEWYASIGDTTPVLERQIRAALKQEMDGMPTMSAALHFNVVDAITVRYASEQSSKLIKNLTDTVRSTVRTVIAEAVAGKYTVDGAARALDSVIGLHPAWADAVIKQGERSYARAIKEGRTPEQATVFQKKQMDKYAAKLTRTRAMNVARTEIQTAQNLGRYASWEHTIKSGYMGPDSLKEWSPGPGACGYCTEISGERVPWESEFSNGLNMPPGHPGCRCTANLIPGDVPVERINWLSPNLASTYRKAAS